MAFKIAILISGRGSNMQALLNACAAPGFPAECAVIMSNRPDAPGLEFAENAGIPTKVVNHKTFSDRETFEEALHEALSEYQVDLICLAGFMRLLGANFVNRWRDKIVNIHPSLLPAYKGLHTHERVLEDGVRFTGCTIHFVRPEMDAGPIIFQACVPVMQDDSESDLETRVLAWEHKLYPLAVRLIAENKVRISGGIVQIDTALAEQPGLMSPALAEN